MSFIDQYQNTQSDLERNILLWNWMMSERKQLFKELRTSPDFNVFEFWSSHPGNPDLKNPVENNSGSAFLLTSWQDVKFALENFSKVPYDRESDDPDEFLLSVDGEGRQRIKTLLKNAVHDIDLQSKIDKSIELTTEELDRFLTAEGAFDVCGFARRVALRFCGLYFGIKESRIFFGDANLEVWSKKAYRNFIWKIHARHFNQPKPSLDGALKSIAYVVAEALQQPIPNTVIGRLAPAAESDIFKIKNIVGLIQGLVDNVFVGSCVALHQLLKDSSIHQSLYSPHLDDDTLLSLFKRAHKLETPSPYLPRRGLLSALPSQQGRMRASSHEAPVNFICAVGSALDEYCELFPEDISDDWDIRMGSGLHRCVGDYIGDRLSVAIIKNILKLGPFRIERYDKTWDWIVDRFFISSKKTATQALVKFYTSTTQHRPLPYSTWSNPSTQNPQTSTPFKEDYTAWPSLVDKRFYSRHLPSKQWAEYPPVEQTKALFRRDCFQPSRSSLLFAFFAQWLTDSFLRTDNGDRRKNTSNHQIDMCQIYGLTPKTTHALRSFVGGKLKTTKITNERGEEQDFPPLLFTGDQVAREFQTIPYVEAGVHEHFIALASNPVEAKKHYFATGLERGNSTIGYAALSTIFIREHNRLCERLQSQYPHFDDERLFQTARSIVIALELKIVIEEYINHIISDAKEKRVLVLDNFFAETQAWYRPNWVSIEFDLLYRWHSLIPNTFSFGANKLLPFGEIRVNNALLISHGAEEILRLASGQVAGKITLTNTPELLLPAEEAAIRMGRQQRLASYNDYRSCFGLERFKSFDQFGDLGPKLEQEYCSDINDLEFLIGVMAEPAQQSDKLFGELMTRMVAYDAFSHALTNPLLSKNIWGPQTFTPEGMQEIANTHSLEDILQRNCQNSMGSNASTKLTMDFA